MGIDVSGLLQAIAASDWAELVPALSNQDWQEQCNLARRQVAGYLARFPELGSAALCWDDTGAQSAVLVYSEESPDGETLVDFSSLIESVFDKRLQAVRETEGEDIYEGMARLLTNLVAHAAFAILAKDNRTDFRLGLSYLDGERPRLIWGKGHHPALFFRGDGRLALPPTPLERFNEAVEDRNYAAIEELTAALCRSNDVIEVLSAPSLAFTECARGERPLEHADIMHLLGATKVARDHLGQVFGDDIEKIVTNALCCVTEDQVAFQFICHNLIDPTSVRSDVLAANVACIASRQKNKPLLLEWARIALERGKSKEDLLRDADFDAYRADPDLLAVLDDARVSPAALGDALHDAADELDLEEMQRLISQGADVNHEKGHDTVFEAALGSSSGGFGKKRTTKKVQALRLLLDAGAEVDLNLRSVVFRGEEIVRLYIEYGAEPSLEALCEAVEKESRPLIELFLDSGLRLSPLADDDESPLSRCRRHERSELLDYLIDRGAVLGEGSSRRLVLDAASANNPGLIRHLVAQGMDPNWRDAGGTGALSAAAFNDNEACARVLLELGCDPNARDRQGQTILHDYQIFGAPSVLAAVLEGGADPTIADDEGNTPLHCAAEAEKVSVARALLEHGADPRAVNKEGKRPAEMSNSPQLRELLDR